MAAITLLPLYLFDGISDDNFQLTPILAMLTLGVLGSGFAYIWNFSIIAAAGGSIASTVTYITPVVAVFVGWLFLGEPITWHEIVGAVLVIIGAAITQGRLKRRAVSR
jgi:drug/metabolite transporter (DMT)-like permease